MCWSANVSLSTFIIALAGTFIAYVNQSTPLGLVGFYLLFASMQLVEYFLWSAHLPNAYASFIGFVIIALQPLYLAVASRSLALIALWVLMMVLWITLYPPTFNSYRGQNGHMVWEWIPKSVVLVLWLFVFIIGMHSYQRKQLHENPWPTSLFIAITVSISLYAYYKHNTWGSMWCWVSNIIFVYVIFQAFAKDFKSCVSVL